MRRQVTRNTLILIRALALLLSTSGTAFAEAPTPGSERWFVTTIDDRPVGSVYEQESVEAGVRTTSETMYVALNRMGSRIEMSTRTIQRENGSGELLSLDFQLEMSEQRTALEVIVDGNQLLVTRRAGEGVFESRLDLEGTLLGPAGIRAASARLGVPGDEISYQTLSPLLGAVTQVTRRLIEIEPGEPGEHGELGEVRVIEEEATGIPVATRYRLDADSRIVGSETPGPFGLSRTILADEAAARLADAGGELPEESYGASLMSTQVRLPNPRRTEWVRIELSHRAPELGWPELDSETQRVVERSPERLVVEISRRLPTAQATRPVSPSAATRDFLAANAYLQSDEPTIRALATEIIGDERDVLTAGLALERWVAQNMEFDMGVVMAPSVEVLENRRGTCTEYAVLLTTLARAADIPARFVMGYVYVNGIYGGHAWTEILVGDEWISLDAAVITEGPADAARLAFEWTALEAGAAALNVGGAMQLYGQVDVRLLGYRLENRSVVELDPQMDGQRIQDGVFHDLGLDLRWSRPQGFDFADYDLTWPERVLVALENDTGTRAEIQLAPLPYWEDAEAEARSLLVRRLPDGRDWNDAIDGRPAMVRARDEGLVAAVPEDDGIWILTIEGPDAERHFEGLTAGLDLPND